MLNYNVKLFLDGLRQSLGELKLSSEDSRTKLKKFEENVENANFHVII